MDLEEAKAVDPRRASAWRLLSHAYQVDGRYPESRLANDQAMKADAFQIYGRGILRRRFELALLTGLNTQADSSCRAGLARWPDDPRFSDCNIELWGRSRSDRESAGRALAITDSLAPYDRDLPTAIRSLWAAAILARAGLGDSADRMASRVFTSEGSGSSTLLAEAANLRLVRGDPDSALTLIAAAVQLNRAEGPYVRNAPWFRALRKDQRFEAALRGISPREALTRP
jgi:tetratricopeptide (TPR) repeat protein